MIKQIVKLSQDKPVIEQILEAHNFSYNDLADVLEINSETLRRYRKGERDFRLSMRQIKIINDLLLPFNINICELPDDWILEKKQENLN